MKFSRKETTCKYVNGGASQGGGGQACGGCHKCGVPRQGTQHVLQQQGLARARTPRKEHAVACPASVISLSAVSADLYSHEDVACEGLACAGTTHEEDTVACPASSTAATAM